MNNVDVRAIGILNDHGNLGPFGICVAESEVIR